MAKSKARDITEKTIKRLYALSGNQCAFPDCNISLLSSGSEINFSNICHIKQQNQVDKDIIWHQMIIIVEVMKI